MAAVDCGTNSTRLLIAGDDGATLSRLMRITRLGAGVDGRRALDARAVGRTVDVLEEYRGVMDGYGVDRVRMTATSAARDASNREEFFSAAERVVGVRPELLSGEQEGRLSFAGATSELAAGRSYLVADIGGGSTELAAGRGGEDPFAVCSFDVGCVRVSERWLAGDPPTPSQIGEARAALGETFAAAAEQLDGENLVGLAGTVASLAACDQRLTTYQRDKLHHYTLSRERVEALLAELASMPASERARRPGVEEGRADVIVGGALVLASLMEACCFSACLTSEADILDGLVLTMLR